MPRSGEGTGGGEDVTGASVARPSGRGGRPRSFFPMARGDVVYLLSVIGFAVVALLPWARTVHVRGVALVGWLMALLMIVAPVVALIRVAREGRGAGSGTP